MSLCPIHSFPPWGRGTTQACVPQVHAGTHTHTHAHALACTYMSLSLFCIRTHTCRYRHILFHTDTGAHRHTPQLSAPCIHIRTHCHSHTRLACSLTLSHGKLSLSYTHCPLHTPSPCSQVSLDHMSSCGGGAVWPHLLLLPPPHEGEDAGTQRWGPGCL